MPRNKDRITYSLNGHYRVRVGLVKPLYPGGPTDAQAVGNNFKEVVSGVVNQLLPEGVRPRLINLRVPQVDCGEPLRRVVDWELSWITTLTEAGQFPGYTGHVVDPDPNRGYIRSLVESARVFLKETGVVEE